MTLLSLAPAVSAVCHWLDENGAKPQPTVDTPKASTESKEAPDTVSRISDRRRRMSSCYRQRLHSRNARWRKRVDKSAALRALRAA